MLTLKHLHKAYQEPDVRHVLKDVNLELQPGAFIAIVGESGSGKSTLLNLVAGLELPDSGSIMLDGREITGLDDSARTRLRRTSMGFVFQSFLLLPHLTVLDNASLSLKLNGTPHREAQQRAQAMLEAVGMGALAHRFPGTLSGGESQRVAIARALAHRPHIVLADEPTGNLDPGSAYQIVNLLHEQIRSCNSIGILVTHSTTAAASADRCYRLDGGVLLPE